MAAISSVGELTTRCKAINTHTQKKQKIRFERMPFFQPTLCENGENAYTLPQVNNQWITAG